jgi:hypothetical protein
MGNPRRTRLRPRTQTLPVLTGCSPSVIPGVEDWLLDDEGYLSLLQKHISEVYVWLSARM